MTELFQKINNHVSDNPVILLHFGEELSESLQKSRKKLERFSFTERHGHFDNVSCPTLCLLETQDENKRTHYLGVACSRKPVSTADSRLVLEKMVNIETDLMHNIITKCLLKTQYQKIHNTRRTDKILALTPKQSVCLTRLLAENSEHREDIEQVFLHLMHVLSPRESTWAQNNAINISLQAFGISPQDIPDGIQFEDRRFFEDNIIQHDATSLPGFNLIQNDMTGRFVHHQDDEEVVIYIANRNPLEEMMGVDLIYINQAIGNIIMLQYKMLEVQGSKTEGVFRPNNKFWEQIKKMKIPSFQGNKTDYRLNSNPFFFKFVNRTSGGEYPLSFVISLDHLDQHIKSPKAKGEKGGLRVSYQSLDGLYLRQAETIGLLRSGYIGTHKEETKALTTIFELVAEGGKKGDNIVVAWKKKLSSTDEN